jgi:hypothetical protein
MQRAVAPKDVQLRDRIEASAAVADRGIVRRLILVGPAPYRLGMDAVHQMIVHDGKATADLERPRQLIRQ